MKLVLSVWAAAWLIVSAASVLTLALALAFWPEPTPFSFQALLSSVLFTLLCIPNTLLLVHAHATHWVRPRLQLCVVRIVLMVPIYAIDSLLGLLQRSSVLFVTFRECYEAFVIYNFVLYLISYFGNQAELEALLASKPPVSHVPPMHWVLPTWRMGPRYLSICRRGALQYVVLRLCTTALTCALALLSASGYWLGRLIPRPANSWAG